MELLPTQDDTTRDLLAIIDEIYAPVKSARALDARVRRCAAAAERRELRARIEELERTLAALRSGLDDPHRDVDMARVWAPVALRQREQLGSVTQENAQLRSVLRLQHRLARDVEAVLREMRSLCPQNRQSEKHSPTRSLPTAIAPPLLMRRLDATCDREAARTVEITRTYTRDLNVELNADQRILFFRFRSRTLYPFKLSSVADELWRWIHGQAAPQMPTEDEIYFADSTFEMQKPFGRIEVRGPSVTRRVYTNDGGVLLVSESIHRGTESEHNVMAGLELHESVRVRVIRCDASNPKSPVFVESVTESNAVAVAGAGSDADRHHQSRLERFHKFLETYAAEEQGEGRIKLESRLLDASLAHDHSAWSE